MIISQINNVPPVIPASPLYSSIFNYALHLEIEIYRFRINFEDLIVVLYNFD